MTITVKQIRRITREEGCAWAARRYHDLKRMNELQEQYLYLVNHKIESADEMLDCYAQIKEKIVDISAEQKMIYAENRKLGRLPEDEAEII